MTTWTLGGGAEGACEDAAGPAANRATASGAAARARADFTRDPPVLWGWYRSGRGPEPGGNHSGPGSCRTAGLWLRHDHQIHLVCRRMGDTEDLVDPRLADNAEVCLRDDAALDREALLQLRNDDVVLRGVHAEGVDDDALAGVGDHGRRVEPVRLDRPL